MEIVLQSPYPDYFPRPCLHLQGRRVPYPIAETVTTFPGPYSVPIICYLFGPGPPAFSFGPIAASRWDASVDSVPRHLQQTEPLTMAARSTEEASEDKPSSWKHSGQEQPPLHPAVPLHPLPSASRPGSPLRHHHDRVFHCGPSKFICCHALYIPITLLPKPSYACV